MQHVGIIAEYNPFHEGHAYQLGAVREAETVVVLMSGHFVQRGEAAVLTPQKRARAAIAEGADLVLELPFPFAAASSEYFATAGVRAAAALGLDTLVFGTESADATRLLETAKKSLLPTFDARVAALARTGGAAAAMAEMLATVTGERRARTAWQPNDLLGLAYTRAILKEELPLAIHPIHREGAGYHGTELDTLYPSASALRAAMRRGEDVSGRLPPVMGRLLREAAVAGEGIADIAALGPAMLAALRAMQGERVADGCGFAECGGGLLPRLVGAAWQARDYEELCRLAKSQKYTDGRVRRALLFLLAGVKQDDLVAPPSYLRVLGMNERGRDFLSKTRKNRTVPVVNRIGELSGMGDEVTRQRQLSDIACGLFALCLPHTPPPSALVLEPPALCFKAIPHNP